MSSKSIRRRDFLSAGAVTAASAAVLQSGLTTPVLAETSYSTSTSKPYGVQYYERVTAMWDALSTTELPLLAQAADHGAASLKNKGKLYCIIVGGHMHLAELRQGRAGNPDYLHNWSRHIPPERFDAAGKGDFILFDYPMPFIRAARDRGAFTVGLRVPYYPNQTTPKGVLAMNDIAVNPVFKDVLLPEECASVTLTSHAPFTDGLLYVPEIPAVRALGSSPQGTFNLYWMLTAEIASRHVGGAAMGSTAKAQEFMKILKGRGAKIRANLTLIDTVARFMTEAVAKGARYWNFAVYGSDDNAKLEPWSIMVEENTNRASGLALSKVLKQEDISQKAKAGDFVFVASETSDEPTNIAGARALKQAGLKVIYIGPKTDGSTGDDLSRIADWHIDTFSPEREGVVTIPGMDKKVCPTTGVLYALAQNMVNGQFISHMIQDNMTPLLFMGLHLIGGMAYYNVVEGLFEKRGY